MPIVQGRTTIAANATNDNLMTGSQFLYLPFNAAIEIGLSMDTGETLGDLVAEIVSSGTDILGQNIIIPNNGTINTDRDLYFEDTALAGDQILIRVRNTTATPTAVNFLVRITEL